MSSTGTLPAETITVTVRDQSREPAWGSGPLRVCTRAVEISAFCRICGARRGERRGFNQAEDGIYFWVQVWENPCGHVDLYPDVVKEAEEIIRLRQDALLRDLRPGDRIRATLYSRATDRTVRLEGEVVEVDQEKRLVLCRDEKSQGWIPINAITALLGVIAIEPTGE